MTDTTQIRTVALDTPIQRGETVIESLQIRKPRAGELRGLSLVELGQLKVDALGALLPRITLPPVHRVAIDDVTLSFARRVAIVDI